MNTAVAQPVDLPACLREHDQWVCWRVVERDGKPTKLPVNPRNGEMASSTNAETWASFADTSAVAEREGLGIGFVFTEDDPFVGIDLDDCVANADLTPNAKRLVDSFATYAEISPSGNGVKLIGIGQKPGEKCRSKAYPDIGEIEIYDKGRFFTITGERINDLDVSDVQAPLDTLYGFLFRDKPKPALSKPATPLELDDPELLEAIRRSGQAAKFEQLWAGDTSGHGGDHSAADSALCTMLAFWLHSDTHRIDDWFRRSGLMRDKWDRRTGDTTYGALTIKHAIEVNGGEHYEPKPHDPVEWPKPNTQQFALEFEQHIDDIAHGRERVIAWPWEGATNTRALMPGTVTILCGTPGASKSFLILEAAAYWHAQGVPSRVLMLEEDQHFHMRRALAQRTHQPGFTDNEWLEQNGDTWRAEYDPHSDWVASFTEVICTPPNDVDLTVANILGWLEDAANEGVRVAVLDPISMADGGEKQWVSDKRLMAKCKQIAQAHKMSVVCVTHPVNNFAGPGLDAVAGGKSITRFAQTVLWLEYLPEPESEMVTHPSWQLSAQVECNRRLIVLKARNAIGGRRIAMNFLPESLTFKHLGTITRQGGK